MSTSSSSTTGFIVPASVIALTMRPGCEPTYVRRCPRISASSRMPPSGDAHELAAHGAGDRLAERRLADTRRTDQRDDGAGAATRRAPARPPRPRCVPCAQLAHGEELDDARLDVGRGRSGPRRGSRWAASRSIVSSLRTPHGSSNTRSSHVRIHPCSGDCALVRSSRSISLARKFFVESGASRPSSFVRYSPTTSSSPSPSSLRIAASCWRSRNSRCCLSTPSVTSLRIVSATCSSAR